MIETTNKSFDNKTTAAEVAQAYPEAIKDRTILITGINKAGLGFAVAEGFASQTPKYLILAGRSKKRVRECIDDLVSRFPNVNIRPLIVDLSSQMSVRAAADEVLNWKDIPIIHTIINNAGLCRQGASYDGPVPTSQDGLEDMFAVNHVGHFLLTNLIISKVVAGAKDGSPGSSRIVNVSSSGTWIAPFRASDIDWKKPAAELPENERPNLAMLKGAGMDVDESTAYIPTAAYCHSKTCNVLYSVGLNERLFSKHSILSLSLDPGEVRTELMRNSDRALVDELIKKRTEAGRMNMKTLAQGASTTLVAACDPKLGLPESDGNGQYFSNCQIAPAPHHAVDKEAAEKLWQISEKLTGQVFAF